MRFDFTFLVSGKLGGRILHQPNCNLISKQQLKSVAWADESAESVPHFVIDKTFGPDCDSDILRRYYMGIIKPYAIARGREGEEDVAMCSC